MDAPNPNLTPTLDPDPNLNPDPNQVDARGRLTEAGEAMEEMHVVLEARGQTSNPEPDPDPRPLTLTLTLALILILTLILKRWRRCMSSS